MRIAIDVRMLHSSGIGTYVQNLVPRIIRLRPNDLFYLMGRAQDRPDPVWEGLAGFQWINCVSPIYSLRQRFELGKKIPKDTDLFWSPHYDTATFSAKKTLVTVHDLFHLAMGEYVGGPHKRFYASWMFGQVARKAKGIAVISEFTRKELLRLVRVDETKVRTIPNGVDESWSDPVPGERPHPKPYFLYVGNIKPHKNLKRLLDAFGLLMDKIPNDLLLVGQKEGFLSGDEAVQRQAGHFGSRVQFTGVIPRDLLRRYYHFAEALVFPSLYEGFGMPPLEAMACGCPVAASNAASIPEVCGEAALFFDPLDTKGMAEKMLVLARDQASREILIRKGKERAKAFSWDRCAVRTSDLMDQILVE